MAAFQRVVFHAAGPKRATIADTIVENSPGVGEVVAILPQHPQHLVIMMGLLVSKTKRAETDNLHGTRTMILNIGPGSEYVLKWPGAGPRLRL